MLESSESSFLLFNNDSKLVSIRDLVFLLLLIIDNLEYLISNLPTSFFPKNFFIEFSGLSKSKQIFRPITPLFTNNISLIKSPSLIRISPLTEIRDFKEVATLVIKSEL